MVKTPESYEEFLEYAEACVNWVSTTHESEVPHNAYEVLFQILNSVSTRREAAKALRVRNHPDSSGDSKLRLTIHSGMLGCWRCGKLTRIITDLSYIRDGYRFKGTLSWADDLPRLEHLVQQAVSERPDVGLVKKRFSRTKGKSYVSNACASCDAMQGRFYDHKARRRAPQELATIEIDPDDEIALKLMGCFGS